MDDLELRRIWKRILEEYELPAIAQAGLEVLRERPEEKRDLELERRLEAIVTKRKGA